jgi:hypothetical protein
MEAKPDSSSSPDTEERDGRDAESPGLDTLLWVQVAYRLPRFQSDSTGPGGLNTQ